MERIHFQDQINRNKRNSIFLISIIFVFIIALGYVISKIVNPLYSTFIIVISIIISFLYVLISYYNSDKIAIASVGAKEAKKSEYKQYYDAVEGLTIASGLPMPKLYVMNSEQINAFASGRNPKNSVICVTTGALKKLDKHELEGVLSHELSHIANYDIRFMTLTAVMVGMIAIISQIFLRSFQFRDSNNKDNKLGMVFVLVGILLAILAPIAVYFVQMAISRKREFSADASAVKFTRYPVGLIRALKKIKEENKPEKKVNKAVAPLFFADPFVKLTSTHPPIEKRIEVLERM